MGTGGVFHEVDPPARLVCTEKFDDPWYEGEAIVTTIFDERDGKTTVTQTMLFDNRETRDAVLKSGMEGGVAISYDRLADILAKWE